MRVGPVAEPGADASLVYELEQVLLDLVSEVATSLASGRIPEVRPYVPRILAQVRKHELTRYSASLTPHSGVARD